MERKHVLLQGFGSFPLNFKALIERARAAGDDDIEWSIICTTGNYVNEFQNLLGKDAVLYLHSDIKNHLKRPDLLHHLSTYCGNIYQNIESEKVHTKHKKAIRQLRSAAAIYLSMKEFIQKRSPSHFLFAQIEGMDGMTLISLAQELGIPALVPTHARHLGETFFSPDHLETMPRSRPITDVHREKAAQFLRRFRTDETRAGEVASQIINAPQESYSFVHPPLLTRVLGVLRRFIYEPEMREPDILRVSLFQNYPAIANLFWKTRGILNKSVYDISSLNELPKRFAYYPLQYSPESSINTPAPYFIDQLRAIDAIRFSLPSDFQLVVKEHPACINQRPLGFLRSLQKKAGVILARYDMPSNKIVDRAAITFSVSGTAALEAYLKAKPSLTLGNAFFTAFLGGATGIDSLRQRIRAALTHQPTDDEIIESVARVYAVSAPFVMGTPFDRHSSFTKYSLNKTNIDCFYKHLRAEISRRSDRSVAEPVETGQFRNSPLNNCLRQKEMPFGTLDYDEGVTMSGEENAFIRRYATDLGNLIQDQGPSATEVRELISVMFGDLDDTTLEEAGVSVIHRRLIAEAKDRHYGPNLANE